MSRVKQGFRIELDPSDVRREAMGRHAGLSRFVGNLCLDKIRDAFAARTAEQAAGVPADQQTRAPWTAIDLEKLWRSEHRQVASWFAGSGLSSRIPQEACRLRASGLKNWWESKTGERKGRKVGFPKVRKRQHGSRFRYDADRARPATSGINTRRTVDPDAPTCGIDLGLKTFAVIADDTGDVEEVQAPRALKAAQRRLRRADKAPHRTRKGSNNRDKARRGLAAPHPTVANRRSDFLHKLTTRLARTRRARTRRAVAVESLNVAGMVRNRRLARAISDAGFGEFLRQLDDKTGWYGSKVWAADRWYPSSKTCSACGAINAGLTLVDRSWTCLCGAEHDRDHNTARNLLAAMHAA